MQVDRPVCFGNVGAVAAGHPIAVAAGLEALQQGGTAADAAVAASFALMVTLPQACSLGGDAMILARTRKGISAFNGSGSAPAQWRPPVSASGAATATVPGAVHALFLMHEQLGRLPWSALLAAAIATAEQGFPASEELAAATVRNQDLLAESTWPVSRLQVGDILRNDPLAHTLRRLADGGAAEFYQGKTAVQLVASLQARGSLMSAEDLSSYYTPTPEPVSVQLGAARLTVQPPVSQAILGALALVSMQDAPAWIPRETLLVEAMGNAFRSRELVMTASPDTILATAVSPTGQRVTRASGATGGNHTAAVTCVDAEQNVISLLVSIYQEFGCFEYIPELGFFVNNRLTGASLAPLSKDRRPIHTLSPMILETPEAVIALASPGADAQVQVLAQVIDDVLARGTGIGAAIDSPRWRLHGDALQCEQGMSEERVADLEDVGHEVHHLPFGHMNFGAVTAAGFANNRPFSISDRRRSYAADAI
jgi:gamma-glutamyltranspeptidase/glutathione hydrolase